MFKNFKKLILAVYLITILMMPVFVFASSAYDNLQTVGEGGANAPYVAADQYSLSKMAGMIIQVFLSILGVIFLAYLIYGGYYWMTAQGDDEKVNKAKDTITRAVIGLVVIIAAYAISYFVFEKLAFEVLK